MSKLDTGEAYFRNIRARASDRRARAGFQNLVLQAAAPGARVFDFGAGPGIDAHRYAEHGLKVTAYDIDADMREFFARHCREFIASGRIELEQAGYAQFLAQHAQPAASSFDLVASNFAPLNLVPDLPALFARFHALLRPDGLVLASVLSPYFVCDFRYRWAWRNAPRLWRDGCYQLPGPLMPSTRRTLGSFAAASAPWFTLEHAWRGLPKRSGSMGRGVDLRRGTGGSWRVALTSQFMFLRFRRRQH
jgi:SAM-dependent methyltransferase